LKTPFVALVLLILFLHLYRASQRKEGVFSNSKTFSDLGPFKKNIISCSPRSKNQNFYPFLADSIEEITTNDNRAAAGQLKNGVLYVALEARTGMWFPETHDGAGIIVHAFAEKGKPLLLPGPLIRVPEGTEIRVTIHNLIKDGPLVIHGLCTRPANGRDSIVIPYNKTYIQVFKSGAAGTYHYKASAGNLKDEDGIPYYMDSQLYGGFIVDPKNKKIDSLERIMMLGVWDDTLNRNNTTNEEFVINGLSWPYTERLTYYQGDSVRWRVINASGHSHPMHLHGFFFTVSSKGNIDSDTIYERAYCRNAVTELLRPGESMSLQWKAKSEGNWLFHCHTFTHIMPGTFLRSFPAMDYEHMQDISTHALNDMTGLVMGIHVVSRIGNPKEDVAVHGHERNLTLFVRERPMMPHMKGF